MVHRDPIPTVRWKNKLQILYVLSQGLQHSHLLEELGQSRRMQDLQVVGYNPRYWSGDKAGLGQQRGAGKSRKGVIG